MRKRRTVVITGSGSGLGHVMLEEFSKQDFNVIGISKRDFNHEESQKYIGDVTDARFIKDTLEKVRNDWEGIDVIINNAAVPGEIGYLEDISLSSWEKTIKINLTGVFVCCKYVLPIMKDQKRGLIINIGSYSGLRGRRFLSSYSATKFGVVAISQCLEEELAESNIKVFCVCPPIMKTKMSDYARKKFSKIEGKGPSNKVIYKDKYEVANFIIGLVNNNENQDQCVIKIPNIIDNLTS